MARVAAAVALLVVAAALVAIGLLGLVVDAGTCSPHEGGDGCGGAPGIVVVPFVGAGLCVAIAMWTLVGRR